LRDDDRTRTKPAYVDLGVKFECTNIIGKKNNQQEGGIRQRKVKAGTST